MQPKIMIKGEAAIHGLRGDKAEAEDLWRKFGKRFAKKPFDRVGENTYELRLFDGKKPAPVGHEVLVGHERASKSKVDSYGYILLPAGEYAVFDVTGANARGDVNDAAEKWLSDNSGEYMRRELGDNRFAVKCYAPRKDQSGNESQPAVELWLPVSRVGSSAIPELLNDPGFLYIDRENRNFISAFDAAMEKCGYSAGNIIVDGICWGRNMLIYRKTGAKSSGVAARIYMRDNGVCLRMFLTDVSKHAEYISAAPDFIKSVFTGEYGNCRHCKGDNCKFRKDYDIDGGHYEKCNGLTFEFHAPTIERLPEYMKLFAEFFPQTRR